MSDMGECDGGVGGGDGGRGGGGRVGNMLRRQMRKPSSTPESYLSNREFDVDWRHGLRDLLRVQVASPSGYHLGKGKYSDRYCPNNYCHNSLDRYFGNPNRRVFPTGHNNRNKIDHRMGNSNVAHYSDLPNNIVVDWPLW
ncbi:unnamed protein product [Rodentolepis nana]|uniref:Serine/threonine-protein kinase n=1 Tax=Rodentolepis nana TaxID=102285 RepID=A0A0R3T5H7_RODNA|nr:unnamed protein product [Rodentolepis nana]